MDGWMDGWMDGRTDGRTDGRMDGRTDGRTDGYLYIYIVHLLFWTMDCNVLFILGAANLSYIQ